MAKSFTYTDAIRILGAESVTGVGWIDRITGGTFRGVSLPDVLSCFGLGSELVRLGRGLVRDVADRRQGMSRFDRTQRIQAAHAVLVVTAYFEALRAADLPFSLDELELTNAEQVMLVADRSPRSGRAGALLGELLDAAIPLPTPQRPREATVKALHRLYENLSVRLVQFAEGLSAWERQGSAARERFGLAVHAVPEAACAQYEVLLRDLAATFPEVASWANLQDHEATRQQIRELRTALAGLERLLHEISDGAVPDDRIVALPTAHQLDLDRPIVEPGDVPDGLRIPALREAYIDPLFRVADVPLGSTPSEDSWWHDVPVRDDMNAFLAGYLTSPQATQAPLLVLGQPGSGKSVLTRVLAARLPPKDFLVVRVVLQEIPADMDLQDQVEQAVRRATGERFEWPALVRSAAEALPVVLLDGFDEMLQATGVSQTDYLVKVRGFQQRELAQGRPVVAVVTSRITVANRARIPDDTVAIRLEPFDRTQVTQWLDMWRDTNARYFDDNELTALPARTALAYPDLALQPLLLLMLALYDADSNVLQKNADEFSRADLYERLLLRFVQREVTKAGERHGPAGVARAVEEGLRSLSVVAFAMFNRASQFVSEADLDTDLAALFGDRTRMDEPQGFRAPLGAAELVLGQFFFVQESQALRGERRLRTYEFLHATFGEYLVARLIWQVLANMVAHEAAVAESLLRVNTQDDGALFALLSFAPLTSRPSVIGFLTELAHGVAEVERRPFADLLTRLCTRAQEGRDDRGQVTYEPRRLPAATRHALYTANLMVLVVITKEKVRLADLFRRGNPASAWYQHALLWRSQMRNSEFESLVNALTVRGVMNDGTLDVWLTLDDGSYVPPHVDLDQIFVRSTKVPPGEPGIFVSTDQDPDALRRRALFTRARSDAVTLHALEPLATVLKSSVNSFVRWEGEQLRSTAYVLMQAVFLPLDTVDRGTMARVYQRCAAVAMLDRLPWSDEVRDRYCTALLGRLRVDDQVEPAVVDEVLTVLLPRQGVRTDLVLCAVGVLGRDPSCDRALVAKLQALVNPDWVQREPAVAVEVWSRLVEVGLVDGVQGILGSAGAFFRCVDPVVVRAVRPELVTRARWAVADRGCAAELPPEWVAVLG